MAIVLEAEISVASMIPRQPIEHGSRTWCSKFLRVWSSVTPRCADNRKPIIYHPYFTTECPTRFIDRGYTVNAFYDGNSVSKWYFRTFLFRLVCGARVNVPGLRSICQSIAKFSKTIRFLRYCPTWPKNWCVRLNPRAHFTRYRSEPIDVLGIFIHVVCNALFFYNWRPTAVQALFFFYSQHCLSGRLSAQYAQRSVALRVTWSVRHSKSDVDDDPTRVSSFWNLL